MYLSYFRYSNENEERFQKSFIQLRAHRGGNVEKYINELSLTLF